MRSRQRHASVTAKPGGEGRPFNNSAFGAWRAFVEHSI